MYLGIARMFTSVWNVIKHGSTTTFQSQTGSQSSGQQPANLVQSGQKRNNQLTGNFINENDGKNVLITSTLYSSDLTANDFSTVLFSIEKHT